MLVPRFGTISCVFHYKSQLTHCTKIIGIDKSKRMVDLARKKIKRGATVCDYRGVEVPRATLEKEYGSRDYVASAVKDHRTKEMVYVDAQDSESCYGRFAQDPIDEAIFNAKILWRKGRMVLVATTEIEPADEIYAHYGLDYWSSRLGVLDPSLRSRIEDKAKRVSIRFQGECTVAEFAKDRPPSSREGLKVHCEGEPLLDPPDNYLTRLEKQVEPTEEIEPEEQEKRLDQKLL